MPTVMTQFLTQIGAKGFSCNECGRNLHPTAKVIACADCGAIICEKCVNNERVSEHVCDADDFEFD